VLTIGSRVFVRGLTGRQTTDFLLEPRDDRYQQWWPGTHLRFHRVGSRRPGHRGEVVLMDEYVGSRHIRLTGVVTDAIPGRRIVWRLAWRISLPAWLRLELTDRTDGVQIQHTITAGYPAPARILDPLFRLYFTNRFAVAMDEHVHEEFHPLRDLLAIDPPSQP
jgi:hypothetical protein